MRPLDTIVEHYSATAPGDNVTVETIDKWHRDRGFRKIGYHFYITRDGKLWPGREVTELGAGVKNRNTGKVHICWEGGVTKENRNKGVNNKTAKQEETLIKLIRNLQAAYPSLVNYEGHRDVADPAHPTQCPGHDAGAWWRRVNSQPVTADRPPRGNAVARTPSAGMGEDAPRGLLALIWQFIVRLFRKG